MSPDAQTEPASAAQNPQTATFTQPPVGSTPVEPARPKRRINPVLIAAILIVLLVIGLASAHLYLLEPVSRGGPNNIGGMTSPCNGLQQGVRSRYNPGQMLHFQFRANQHGPGPFALKLDMNGQTNFSIVLISGVNYAISADEKGFTMDVTLPTTPCTQCTAQLSGMAQQDGSATWYQCADIYIRTAPLPCAKPTSMGFCQAFVNYEAVVESTTADTQASNEYQSASQAYANANAVCQRKLKTIACINAYRRCDPDNNGREIRVCKSVCDQFKTDCGAFPVTNVPSLTCTGQMYSTNPNDTACWDPFVDGVPGAASGFHAAFSVLAVVLSMLALFF